MANKLHRPINAGASGCCGADTVGVYSGTGSILVMKTGMLIHGSSSQSECWRDIIIPQKWLVHIANIYCNWGVGLSSLHLCYSHPSTNQLQSSDKRSKTTFLDVRLHSVLISSKLLQCHDIIERKSPLHPLYCPLFGQLHHMGPSCIWRRQIFLISLWGVSTVIIRTTIDMMPLCS